MHLYLDTYNCYKTFVHLYLDTVNFYEIHLHTYLDMFYFIDMHAFVSTYSQFVSHLPASLSPAMDCRLCAEVCE